jgi:hypothetical protein
MISEKQLAKIRALAADERGDPATRAVAQAALKRYASYTDPHTQTSKNPYQFVDQRHPGMKTSAEYDRYRFLDLGSWRLTTAGNPTFSIAINGKMWRVVLFKHKKTPTYGWMRIDMFSEETEFSSRRFKTMAEAHQDIWKILSGT